MAEEYDKSKWGIAILGVVSYYLGTAALGLILGVVDVVFELNINFDNTILMTLIALPAGLLVCYLVYSLLKKNWKKNIIKEAVSIDDIGKDNDN